MSQSEGNDEDAATAAVAPIEVVWVIEEVECSKCGHEWRSKHEEKLTDKLECPSCHAMQGEKRNNDLGLPNWYYNHLVKCQHFLSTEPMRIYPKWVDGLQDDKGNPHVGQAVIDYTYQTAKIRIRSDQKGDTKGYETVTHEVAHVALWRIQAIAERAIALIKDADIRAQYEEMWKEANETTVELLGRSLTKAFLLIEASDVAADDVLLSGEPARETPDANEESDDE